MEWPSKNIPKGGIFNNARVQYTPETQAFVRTLINESKMSTMQRNKVNYSLRNGEPLPPLPRDIKQNRRGALFEVRVRPGSSKRRSLDTIRQSGAYERESYRPNPHIQDREKAKEALIEKMVFGTSKPATKHHKTSKKEKPQEINRFEELKKEIKEREDWLADMEALGEGAKYRGLIRLQILERIKEMESLQVID